MVGSAFLTKVRSSLQDLITIGRTPTPMGQLSWRKDPAEPMSGLEQHQEPALVKRLLLSQGPGFDTRAMLVANRGKSDARKQSASDIEFEWQCKKPHKKSP